MEFNSAVKIGQDLIDACLIMHVSSDQVFANSGALYRPIDQDVYTVHIQMRDPSSGLPKVCKNLSFLSQSISFKLTFESQSSWIPPSSRRRRKKKVSKKEEILLWSGRNLSKLKPILDTLNEKVLDASTKFSGRLVVDWLLDFKPLGLRRRSLFLPFLPCVACCRQSQFD